MPRAAVRAAAALAAAALATSSTLCLPEYETTYVVTSPLGAFTYNLSALCSPTGYKIDIAADSGYVIEFNIGGDSPAACSPVFSAYNSRGAVVQFLAVARPQPADCANPACFDWDKAAAPRCCDAPCYVLATDWLSFSLLAPEAPATSGFRIDYPPAPDLLNDTYPCAALPAPSTLRALRTVAVEVACDPLAGPGLQALTFNEVSSCSYVIQARSANACPLAAVPTPSPLVTSSASTSPTGSATSSVSTSPTGSATGSATSTPTASATGPKAAAPSATATVPFVSAFDRDAGLFLGGSVAGVAVALVSVALSMRGYCDCFRGRPGEEARLLGGSR
jgi:hypothetical protein